MILSRSPLTLFPAPSSRAAKLTKALNKVLDDLEEYTAHAERLARRIYEENGIQGAAEVVEGEAALAATRG